VLLDFGGGILSIAQLLFDSSRTGNWSGVIGDPVKFGLGLLSVFFDVIFMVQHYILYKGAPEPEYERIEDPYLLGPVVYSNLLLFTFAEYIGESAFTTILSVKVACHEDTSSTVLVWAFSSETSDFAAFIDFVAFQDGELDLLLLVGDLLGLGVDLLLSLLSTTS